MTNKFDTTPRLMLPLLYDNVVPQPGFSESNLNQLSAIMVGSLPHTRFVLVGYLAESDAYQITSAPLEQKLDSDLFLPVEKTDPERWQEIVQENQLGSNPNIIISGGFTYLSPELSSKSEADIKIEVSASLARHLPQDHVFSHIGRTREPLTVVGENVSTWGHTRRSQKVGDEKPYLEIVPLVTDGNQSFLDDELELIGISTDLAPRYCSFYQGDYSPLDLHLHRPQIAHHSFFGLPSLNWDYIDSAPDSGLHWIRREIKALSLYQQIDPELFSQQTDLFMEHVRSIVERHPQVLENHLYLDKINQALKSLVPAVRSISDILQPEVIVA